VLGSFLSRRNRATVDPRYLRPGPTYDIPRRLADERARHRAVATLDAGEVEHEGSQLKQQSSLLFATAIPAAFAFLCGALAHGFGTWRRWLVPLGFALCGVAFVLALIVELSF
jgi:hypothetical protein